MNPFNLRAPIESLFCMAGISPRISKMLSWAFFLLLPAGMAAWMYAIRSAPSEKGIPAPLRKGLQRNEAISKVLPLGLVREYPKEKAVKKVRVNGKYGLKSPLDSIGYRVWVVHPDRGDSLGFPPSVFHSLPKTEVVFDFKCIEGWNQITYWGGVRFSDFIRKFYPDLLDSKGLLRYAHVGLSTPDNKYYVGIDAASIMHPQTLLCYELNGKPLPVDQGYPLRLIIPVKYGIKHLKRIGSMRFSQTPARDYWFEKGYDYDSGH